MLAVITWPVLVVMTFTTSVAEAGTPVTVLDVPHVSQRDGSHYAGSNCGPASLAMVLRAYGIEMSVGQARAEVNRLQGTSAYDSGTAIETVAEIVESHGLTAVGLMDGDHHTRWTGDRLVREIQAGHPVIPEVRYRRLPGHVEADFDGDHYVVLIGIQGYQVIYHDPAFSDGIGANRRISMNDLLAAMAASAFPYAAVAVAPGSGRAPLTPQAVATSTSGSALDPDGAVSRTTSIDPSRGARQSSPSVLPSSATPSALEPAIAPPSPTTAPVAAAQPRPANPPTRVRRPVPTATVVPASHASDNAPLVTSVRIEALRIPSPSAFLPRLPARPPVLDNLPVISLPRIKMPPSLAFDLSVLMVQLRSTIAAGKASVGDLRAIARSTATAARSAIQLAWSGEPPSNADGQLPGEAALGDRWWLGAVSWPQLSSQVGVALIAVLVVSLGLVRGRHLRDRSRRQIGRLVFVDAADHSVLGQVRLSEKHRTVQWSLSQCTERLPAVGLRLLHVEHGPIVEGKTTVRLTVVGPDGHTVMRLFRDRDSTYLNDAADRQVVYEAEFDRSGSHSRGANANSRGGSPLPTDE